MSTQRRSRARRPAAFTLIKDIGAWVLGVGLIVHQAAFVPPQDFNITLTLLGATLVGVPGVSQLLAARIGGSPSQDPLEASPEPPPSSSSASAGAER